VNDPTPLSTDPYHIAYALRAGDPNRTDPQLLRDAEAVILELAKYRDEWKLKFQSLVEDKYKAMRERDIARRERDHWKSNHDNATRKVKKMGEVQAEITALREAVRVLAEDLAEYTMPVGVDGTIVNCCSDAVNANPIAFDAIKEAGK